MTKPPLHIVGGIDAPDSPSAQPLKKKRRVSARGSRKKGNRFELELAAHLSATLGLTVARTKTSTPIFSTGGVGNPDLAGTPLLAIEAKRNESLEYRKALDQAKRNASGGDLPIVINRRSRESIDDAVCFMRLSDFLQLYRRALIAYGLMKP